MWRYQREAVEQRSIEETEASAGREAGEGSRAVEETWV
jgi:hypothetical protein